jgi:hypothetical protein
MARYLLVIATAILAYVIATPTARAQTATATLSGVIIDQGGGLVPGVTVTVRNPATGAARTVTTDDRGRYTISNLEPGAYELRAELQGFRTAVRDGIVLTVGGSTAMEVQLTVGQVAEQVTVTGQQPLIETTATDRSRVVGTVEIESLPNIGRNFVDFVKLASGVAPGRENVGGGAFKEPDTGVGIAAAPRLSFGGQSELNTLIQVDGADNVQTFTGLPRATPSQEAAQEFRILNSTYLAEYGRALGGFVNIVTRSGTNDAQGSVYYFGMDDSLAARSALVRPEFDTLSQHQYGGTLGGPLVRDRSFVFLNYEGQRREESNRFSQVILDNLDALNAVRARFSLKPETLDQVRSNDYDQVLVKLDQRLNDKHRTALRYNYLRSEALKFPGGGGRASPASSAARDNQTRDQAAVATLTSVFSPTFLNEARVQWSRRSYDFLATTNEPALEISNLILMGKTTSDMDFYRERRVQATDSLLLVRGSHQIKFGADVNVLGDEAQWNLFFPARIIFPTLQAFSAFTPAVFWWPQLKDAAAHPGFSTSWSTAVPSAWDPQTRLTLDHSMFGVFAQDEWKIGAKVTLNYGVRYDVESYPEPYIAKTDLNNIQPRVGAAYAYSSRGVVRAGYGMFTDRLASSVGQLFWATEWLARGDLSNAQVVFPSVARVHGRFNQNTIGGAAATTAAMNFMATGQLPVAPAIATGFSDNMDADLRNQYSHQTSVEVSQEVGPGLAVSASYLFLDARAVPITGPNLNAVETGELPTGKPIIGGRRFIELGDFFVVANRGWSTYHGATFEIEKRFQGNVGFHASYTVSRTRSNGDSVANLADFSEGLDRSREEGLSRQHVPHRFTV